MNKKDILELLSSRAKEWWKLAAITWALWVTGVLMLVTSQPEKIFGLSIILCVGFFFCLGMTVGIQLSIKLIKKELEEK